MKKIVVAWVFSVLALVGLFAWLGTDMVTPSANTDQGKALINGNFSLTNAEGKTITNADFKDRYLLVFFGFTHCPDVCPTGLLLMQNVMNKLGKKAEKLQPIFITVDPERDTPQVVANYVKNFGNAVIGLSGTPEQIKATANNYRVYYSKMVNDDPAMGYMIDHSAFVYLIDPEGNYVTHFSSDSAAQVLEEGIRKHIN